MSSAHPDYFGDLPQFADDLPLAPEVLLPDWEDEILHYHSQAPAVCFPPDWLISPRLQFSPVESKEASLAEIECPLLIQSPWKGESWAKSLVENRRV
jgi:hypothetical protein